MYSAYKLNKQGDNIVLSYTFPNLEPLLLILILSSGFQFSKN